MDDTEFIAFDLETTGLSPDLNRIVEVGAVRFRLDGTELDRMEQLVDPRCVIPADVTEIHGITDEMVCGQPPIEQVLPEFVEFLGFPETILLAHKTPTFVNQSLARLVPRQHFQSVGSDYVGQEPTALV